MKSSLARLLALVIACVTWFSCAAAGAAPLLPSK